MIRIYLFIILSPAYVTVLTLMVYNNVCNVVSIEVDKIIILLD